MNDKIYGKFAVSADPMPGLPPVDHILGCRLSHDKQGNPSQVTLQYQSTDHKFHDVDMSFLDAMFLLSALKAIQLDTGTPFPDDPRGSPA